MKTVDCHSMVAVEAVEAVDCHSMMAAECHSMMTADYKKAAPPLLLAAHSPSVQEAPVRQVGLVQIRVVVEGRQQLKEAPSLATMAVDLCEEEAAELKKDQVGLLVYP